MTVTYCYPEEIKTNASTPCVKIVAREFKDYGFMTTDTEKAMDAAVNHQAQNSSSNSLLNNITGSLGALSAGLDAANITGVSGRRIGNTVATFYLPMPGRTSDNVSPDWEIADSQVLGAARAIIAQETIIGKLMTVGGQAAAYISQGGKLSQKQFGAAINPRKQAVFNGVDPRTFNLDFSLTARSQKDAEQIQAIVKELKKYILPGLKDTTSAFLDYPYEFEVKYINVVGYPIYTYCVCTNFSVDLTQNTSQIMRDGRPMSVGISMTFKETNILTYDSPGI